MYFSGSAGSESQTVKRKEAKVGRNDPCPCGSGKKYKKCHGRLEQTSQTSLPPDVFPEDVVVSEILRTSPQFRAFYDTERKRIPHRVEWKLNPSLPESMGGEHIGSNAGLKRLWLLSCDK